MKASNIPPSSITCQDDDGICEVYELLLLLIQFIPRGCPHNGVHEKGDIFQHHSWAEAEEHSPLAAGILQRPHVWLHHAARKRQ